VNRYPTLLEKVTQILKSLFILIFEKANFHLGKRQRLPVMFFYPIKREKWLFIFPHPEGGKIACPRDDLDKKIPMSLEGIFIGSK
jgi:hypothetical protein